MNAKNTKVTRIIYIKKLNQGKYNQLLKQAKLLGHVRSEVWQRFASMAGVDIRSDRIIKKDWVKDKRQFGVLATPWKETLRDSFGDIKANRESAKKKVRKLIAHNRNYNYEDKKQLYKFLKTS